MIPTDTFRFCVPNSFYRSFLVLKYMFPICELYLPYPLDLGRFFNKVIPFHQKEKETTEDEMVGWHHWLSEYEFEQTPGDSEGQGSLECCDPWVCKELDTT